MNPSLRQARATQRSRLRRLLLDGRWHRDMELLDAARHRFGARLFELHNAEEEPLHYERKHLPNGHVTYRLATQDRCTVCLSKKQ